MTLFDFETHLFKAGSDSKTNVDKYLPHVIFIQFCQNLGKS